MIDITERVEGSVDGGRQINSDLDALKYHIEDIVENESPDLSSISTITVPHLPQVEPFSGTLILTTAEMEHLV